MQSRYGNCITEEVMEMPRCCSRRIQSEVAWRAALRPLTVPAIWMAPPNSSNFSVSVVLPASGCDMMANVRRLLVSPRMGSSAIDILLRDFRPGLRARGRGLYGAAEKRLLSASMDHLEAQFEVPF